MNVDFVMSFALLFSATIALICAAYIAIYHKKKINEEANFHQEIVENS